MNQPRNLPDEAGRGGQPVMNGSPWAAPGPRVPAYGLGSLGRAGRLAELDRLIEDERHQRPQGRTARRAAWGSLKAARLEQHAAAMRRRNAAVIARRARGIEQLRRWRERQASASAHS